MNASVNYDRHAANVRQIMALWPAHAGRGRRVEALLEGEVPRLLAKVEQKLTGELRASGVGAEAAAHSALFFVHQMVEHYGLDRADRPA